MTTKPSSAPWVDGPYKLIPTPKKYMTETHSFVQVASEMTGSHNCLLRGLNAILLQAPHIASSEDSANYRKQDVKDLLFYVDSWVKMVDHHHHTEETCIFPKIAAMAGEPDLLNHAEDQHKDFHTGLAALGKYTTTMQDSPDKYSWPKMKEILDGFTESLTKHLYDEVEEFVSFKRLDSDGLLRCWKEGEEVAKAEGNFRILYDGFPVVLGCCDSTYEGGSDFPPLPSVMRYAIQYWFGTYNPGAWRFNPCDFWGRPRPLQMLPPTTA